MLVALKPKVIIKNRAGGTSSLNKNRRRPYVPKIFDDSSLTLLIVNYSITLLRTNEPIFLNKLQYFG